MPHSCREPFQKEVQKLYKKVIDRNYPVFKYGLAKKSANNWKPYPPQFKKDFFEIVRAYARTTMSEN